jgi:hypothetical protein
MLRLLPSSASPAPRRGALRDLLSWLDVAAPKALVE